MDAAKEEKGVEENQENQEKKEEVQKKKELEETKQVSLHAYSAAFMYHSQFLKQFDDAIW